MPLPSKHESLNDYLAKFMSAKSDQKWKPKQRAAIAYSEYKKSKRK